LLGIESERLAGASKSGAWDWGLPVFPPDEDLRLRRFPRDLRVLFVDNGKTETREDPSWVAQGSRTIRAAQDRQGHS